MERIHIEKSGDIFKKIFIKLAFENEVSERTSYEELLKFQLTFGGMIIIDINGNYLYHKQNIRKKEKRLEWVIEIDLREYGFEFIPLFAMFFQEIDIFIYAPEALKKEVWVDYEEMDNKLKDEISHSFFYQDLRLPKVLFKETDRQIYIPEFSENKVVIKVKGDRNVSFCGDGNELLSTYYGNGYYEVELNTSCILDVMGLEEKQIIEIYGIRNNKLQVWAGLSGLMFSE